MAVSDYYALYTEKAYGHNSTTGNTDNFNKLAKYLWGLFEMEHEPSDGSHQAALTAENWVVEEGTYTGNGVDDRNISLSDAGLDIKFIRIWSEGVAYTFFRSEDMAGDATLDTSGIVGFAANHIQSVGTGTFQVGDSANVNDNGVDFYYVAYGVS